MRHTAASRSTQLFITIMRFDELYLSDDILDAIDSMHFTECTPIQEKTIPLITEGKDVIAVAQTGTGKTAAYLLPVIDEIANGDYPQDAINCIVMAPTRELAQQIDQQMQGFSYFMPVNSVAIYGGTDGHTFEQQKKGLKLGADVVIATPGRLIAHLSMGYVDLSKVSFLILDEADRMLDMGFYEDIMQIVKQLPKDRQTLLFSATMPPKIKNLAKEILHNPAEVKLAVSKPADKIDQSAYVCYETQKIPILCHIFKTLQCDRSIVFASSKVKCKELCKALKGLNLSVGEMHSDLEQSKREDVLLDFKSGKIKILVATDIMARGIDIDDIGLVVNFDVPHENEDYVHRIGRTARANTDGIAITFVSEKEIGKFMRIEKFIEKEIKKNEIPAELGEGPEYVEKGRRGRSGKGGERKQDDRKSKRNGKKNKQKETPSAEQGKSKRQKDANRKPAESPAVEATDKPVENKPVEETTAVDKPVEIKPVEAADDVAAQEATPVAETADAVQNTEGTAEETPKKKRKRRRSKKKKKNGETSQEGQNNDSTAAATTTPSDNDEEEEKSVFDDRPVSYSLVAATMAAEARRRAEREAAELLARESQKETPAEESTPQEETPAAPEEPVAEQPKTKKRRRRGKKKHTDTNQPAAPATEETPLNELPAAATEPAAAEPSEAPATETPDASEPQPEEKPKRRRTTKKAKKAKEANPEPVAELTEPKPEEKPKRRRSTKKATEAKPEPAAEEKPKRRRSAKKATEATEAKPGPATEQTAEPAEPQPEEKPKRRRTTKKAKEATEANPEPATEPVAEEKPKRRRTTKKVKEAKADSASDQLPTPSDTKE